MAETVEIEDTIEQQQAKATESLEISDDHVRCQGCGSLKPLIPEDWRLSAPGNIVGRIRHLRNAITYCEKFHTTGNCKREKEELAELLKEQEKWLKDPLRRLPLYNTRLTGYRWFCNTCYDKADRASRSSSRKKTA